MKKSCKPSDVAVTARVLRRAIFRLHDRLLDCSDFMCFDRDCALSELSLMSLALARLEMRLEATGSYLHLN